MLVIGRKKDQKLVICDGAGNEIWIQVNKVGRNQVRLAIDAPQSVKIIKNAQTGTNQPRTQSEPDASQVPTTKAG